MAASIMIRVIWIAALLLGACKKDDKPIAARGDSSRSAQENERHRAGLANAQAMIKGAEQCEPKSGIGDVEACERACKLNHSNSCANWAAFLESSDRQQARKLYRLSCKGGSGIGCEAEAAYAKEIGAPNSKEIYLGARRYHRVHCSQGYGRSCSQLARLFEQGLGGSADKITGQSYRAQACRLGVASDC